MRTWGPSIHWNTYLERYVMLLNRAKDESFNNEGIYVSYARTLMIPGPGVLRERSSTAAAGIRRWPASMNARARTSTPAGARAFF